MDKLHGLVTSASLSTEHTFSKPTLNKVVLIEGIGVEAGKALKHRSRVAQDSTKPNLRQVHLIHSELHNE